MFFAKLKLFAKLAVADLKKHCKVLLPRRFSEELLAQGDPRAAQDPPKSFPEPSPNFKSRPNESQIDPRLIQDLRIVGMQKFHQIESRTTKDAGI